LKDPTPGSGPKSAAVCPTICFTSTVSPSPTKWRLADWITTLSKYNLAWAGEVRAQTLINYIAKPPQPKFQSPEARSARRTEATVAPSLMPAKPLIKACPFKIQVMWFSDAAQSSPS